MMYVVHSYLTVQLDLISSRTLTFVSCSIKLISSCYLADQSIHVCEQVEVFLCS